MVSELKTYCVNKNSISGLGTEVDRLIAFEECSVVIGIFSQTEIYFSNPWMSASSRLLILLTHVLLVAGREKAPSIVGRDSSLQMTTINPLAHRCQPMSSVKLGSTVSQMFGNMIPAVVSQGHCERSP